MARIKDREKAIEMRLQGMSYSQIKEELNASKSTLHYWLKDYPLSEKRIRELRDWNQQRIERCRETKARKRQERLDGVFKGMEKQIGVLSKRELFITGLFLYWGEGTKTSRYTISLTNSDPSMLRFFLAWLKTLDVDIDKVSAKLHLYSDMDVQKQTKLWSDMLSIPSKVFRKPYIKTNYYQKEKNYKGRFGYGTCSLSVHGRDLEEMVSAGIQVLQSRYNE